MKSKSTGKKSAKTFANIAKNIPYRTHSRFYLNGKLVDVSGDDSFMMLADYLRKQKQMSGTKIVCAEGDCGACTVLRAFAPLGSKKKPKFLAINSCIATVSQMDGSHLVTIEGLKQNSDLTPVQKAMKNCHASQCGYCTPGFVMALSGAFECQSKLDRKAAANSLTGNLCRCTGYAPILDAAESITPTPETHLGKRYLTPTIIKLLRNHTSSSLLTSNSDGQKFFAPTSIKEACKFLATHKNTQIIGAATDLGVQRNKGKDFKENLLSLQNIPELFEINTSAKSMVVGARASLSDLRKATKAKIPEFSKFLDIFASPQIKNIATLIGNLANASPIGDTLPFLLATNAVIHTAQFKAGKIAKRRIPVTEFFLGYKKLALNPKELITNVEIPLGTHLKTLKLYKFSQRKDLDISAVSAALNIHANARKIIQSCSLAFGGVAATPIRLHKIENQLIGRTVDQETMRSLAEEIVQEISPISDVRGTNTYRKVLVYNVLAKYSHEVFNLNISDS